MARPQIFAWITLPLFALSLINCAPRGPAPPAVALASLPHLRTLAGVRRHPGQRVVIAGRYQVTPIASSASGAPASLVLDAGNEIPLFGRPNASLDDEPVLVVGSVRLPSADDGLPIVEPPRIEVERLLVARSARPLASAKLMLPTVGSVAELWRHRGRWVNVIGRLARVRVVDDGMCEADIELPDGNLAMAERVPLAAWNRLARGTAITTVAKVAGDDPHRLLDARVPCRGIVPRCDVAM